MYLINSQSDTSALRLISNWSVALDRSKSYEEAKNIQKKSKEAQKFLLWSMSSRKSGGERTRKRTENKYANWEIASSIISFK